jgi:hypothetical protein
VFGCVLGLSFERFDSSCFAVASRAANKATVAPALTATAFAGGVQIDLCA